MNNRRIGILGGSFDPPTLAHERHGYVSADVRIKNDSTGEEKMLALSCAKIGSFNSGCKARVGGISQN